MNITGLSKATFIALETFRNNGEGVVTPVWVTGKDDKLYVWTDLDSWKVKRIRKNDRVRLCESDFRGVPKSEWLDAKAQVLDTESVRKEAKSLFKSKYGLQFRAFSLMGRKRPKAVVEISNL
jgi:PPOX class probable F420-dependent enzyme